MIFGHFFRKKQQKAPESAPYIAVVETIETQLIALSRQCYTEFLNDYIAHGFDESEAELEVRGHVYTQTLSISKMMESKNVQRNRELDASDLAEQQRQKARRNYREVLKLAESVLVDQRNYLLAKHINTSATEMGFHPDTPFSGIETEYGQPCHAFACKLLADSSLGRGAAQGLEEAAITMLEHHIARRADEEISHFLKLYQQEHVAL
jgi:hypothetical protein